MTKKKVSRLALYVDVRRKAAVSAAQAVAAIADRSGVALQVGEQQAKHLGLDSAVANGTFPASADLVMSLGGDGTLLQAAHLAGPLGIPIIGVDFGHVGFLSEVPRTGYEAVIVGILRDGVKTQAHLALEARVISPEAGTAGKRYYAVNDIHIDRKHVGHIVNYGIELAGSRIATIPADGIVVASPTGSTAYFLSAGGPIMSPALEAFGIAPICPHTLFSRPLIVSADETIRIVLPQEAQGTQLFVDGHAERELGPGAIVEVVRASKPVHFVRLDERFFFQTLEHKLHWGMSVKRAIDDES